MHKLIVFTISTNTVVDVQVSQAELMQQSHCITLRWRARMIYEYGLEDWPIMYVKDMYECKQNENVDFKN